MNHRAALYVRQSHTTEASISIDLQTEVGRKTAERFEVPIVRELIEPASTSAFKNRGRNRKEYKVLLDLIRSEEITCVITYQTDRLSRGGSVGYAPLFEAVEGAGLDANQFVLLPGGWISELELGIRAAVDREEAAKTSRRMLDVHFRAAREGKPRMGCRAYGYEYSPITKTMTVIPHEAEIVRESVRRVLDGESVYGLAQDLNRRSIRTAGGRQWKTSTLTQVLRSARIAGLRSHLGEIVAEGNWEGIISPDEYHRLLAVTANRGLHGPKRAARTFPLVGFLTCGKCGGPLRSMTSSQGERGRRRYVCRGGEIGGCGGIQAKAEFLEDAVRNYIIGVLADPDLRDRLLAAAPAPDDTDRGATMTELREIDFARQRLTDLAVDGVITPAEIRRKGAELNERAAILERRLATASASAVVTLPRSGEELLTLWDGRGIHFQRMLTSILVDHIVVNPATRLGPGRFDHDRLEWHLRA